MAIAVIAVGILLMVLTDAITRELLMRIDPNPRHHGALFDALAGTGVIPAWVSVLHLSGLLVLVIGIVLLFVR